MPYQHGVRVQEKDTSLVAPIRGTAGLQVVFGTAPINLAEDPTAVTNTPVICYSWSEAVKKLGYSAEQSANGRFLYTLCEAMYASFKLFAVAPVIFINVLDPATHKKVNEAQIVDVESLEAVVPLTGILKSSVTVSKYVPGTGGGDPTITPLTADTDYTLSFDDHGKLVVTLLSTGAGASATKVQVTSTSIDPTAVTAADIVGSTSGATEKGLEVLRQIYPKFGMTPGLILAPGWSHNPTVGLALAAKCEEINGYFSCECFIDIDSTTSGCTAYSDVKTAKEAAGCVSKHAMALWPCIAAGDLKFWFSSIMGALTAHTDAENDDVPNLSPSNYLLGATAVVLADAVYTTDGNGGGTWDKEVLLDQLQANAVNGTGVTTAFNSNGIRCWGNNSAIYPASTDPKDRWFCCRRFFSWWGNSFMLTYAQKVDKPANRRLIESIIDAENIRGNAYVADEKCAAAYIEFIEEENPVTNLIDGKLVFHQHLAPYVPAEDILNTLEFDPDALRSALNGG